MNDSAAFVNDLPAQTPIPVTLIAGFLGAGKTTLLNALLRHASGVRFAIVENEFGAVNIDSQLIAAQSSGIIELTNGCICCSVNDDLVRGLESLAARRQKGELAFDWIIIETTGLADPGAIAQTFFAAPKLRDTFTLDGIITVVDAYHAAAQLEAHKIVQRQVGFADRLLISKTDLVEKEALQNLQARLETINVRARQQILMQDNMPDALFADLFGIGGFSLDESLLAEAPRFELVTEQNTSAKAAKWSKKRPPKSLHDDEIHSLLLEGSEVSLSKVDVFVESLINDFGDILLRYKGILAIENEPRKLIFQGVQRVAGFDYGQEWQEAETRCSRIVLIGKNLPKDALEKSFAALATSTGKAE